MKHILEARAKMEIIRRGLSQGKSIVQLSINMPGLNKHNPSASRLINIGERELILSFNTNNICIEKSIRIHTELGPHVFVTTSVSTLFLKKTCMIIEDTHPLGKYFDFDVYDNQGNGITRAMLENMPRKCFICNKAAKVCAFYNNHTTDELLKKLIEDVTNYVCTC